MENSHIIDLSLVREIDLKKRSVSKEAFQDILFKKLYEEAKVHSARNETPKSHLYEPNLSEDGKMQRLRDIDYFGNSLVNAWVFALTLNLPLNEEEIKKIAFKLDPTYFGSYSSEALSTEIAPYRRVTDAVRIAGAHRPPYPAKIPREMEKFLKRLEELTNLTEKGEFYPVEIAAFVHFNIPRIHPFGDANGRTARLLQDLVLYKSGLPPAIFYEGERRSYNSSLTEAIAGYQEREGKEPVSLAERVFYNSIGERVNISLDCILDNKSN